MMFYLWESVLPCEPRYFFSELILYNPVLSSTLYNILKGFKIKNKISYLSQNELAFFLTPPPAPQPPHTRSGHFTENQPIILQIKKIET